MSYDDIISVQPLHSAQYEIEQCTSFACCKRRITYYWILARLGLITREIIPTHKKVAQMMVPSHDIN